MHTSESMNFIIVDLSRLLTNQIVSRRNFSVQCKLQDESFNYSLRIPSQIDRNPLDKIITASCQTFSKTFGSNHSISDITYSTVNNISADCRSKNHEKYQEDISLPHSKNPKKRQKENK